MGGINPVSYVLGGSMEQIKADLRSKQFKNVYLLYGEESFLLKSYKKQLITSIHGDGNEMNYSYFEGNKTNPMDVIKASETLPFFADSRLIVVENSEFFKKNKNDAITKYIENVPETSHIIFIEREIDGRCKAITNIKKYGYIAEMTINSRADLINWIERKLAKEKQRIERSTIHYLIEMVGTNMELLNSELDKLSSYAYGQEIITLEDVKNICTGQPVDKIFEMLDAIFQKEQKKALDKYYDLVTLRTPSVIIISQLRTHIRRLLLVKELTKEGKVSNEIAAIAGFYPSFVGKYQKQGNKYNVKQLKEMMEEVAETDRAWKSGDLNEVVAVELLIVKYSTP